MARTKGLERTPYAVVKVSSSTGAGMMRPQGIVAVKKAARRTRGIVAGTHADDPMFYCAGIKRKVSTAPRLVKKA